MIKEQKIWKNVAHSQKRKWLAQSSAKVLRSIAGLVLAGLIATLLTLFTQPTVHASQLRPVPPSFDSGSANPQPQSSCGDTISLEDCLMNPNLSFQENNKIKNPLAQGNTLFFITPVDATAGNGTVRALWQVMLDIVDAFIVIVLMINGLKIILGGTVFQYANATETLPGMLLALIAAHLSMLIVAFFLGLNNALSAGLYNFAASDMVQITQSGIQRSDINPVCNTIRTVGSIVQPIVSPVINRIPDCFSKGDLIQDISITPTDLNLPNIWDVIGSLGGIASLILKVLGLMLLGQVIIRLLFINLYIIFAPLGIACWALPGKIGQPLTRMWLQGFISAVMVQFIQVAALIITQVMIGVIMSHLTNLPGLDPQNAANFLNDQTAGQDQRNFLLQIAEIAIMWFILRIPSLFNTAPTRAIAEAGQAMGQVAGASFAVGAAELQGVVSLAGAGLGLLAA